MTEEGQTGSPMDAVEVGNAMVGLAHAYMAFLTALIEEGVPLVEAHKAARAWLHGTAGGKFEG